VAHTLQDQRKSYPLAAYNFRVTVDGIAMRFAKVSGLQREHQTVTYQHGLSFSEGEQITKFHRDRYVTLTLEQGSVVGSTSLHEWLERPADHTGGGKPALMEVSLCDEKGNPAVTWSIAKAIAVKLTAPAFDAAGNALSIETLEVKASGICIKHQL
jgi:phage tail-like protein